MYPVLPKIIARKLAFLQELLFSTYAAILSVYVIIGTCKYDLLKICSLFSLKSQYCTLGLEYTLQYK